ncbi:adenylate kinase [Thermofilum sp.]|jgi:adenylate kinase|uniref:adenylate kinase n=1 Tax=Thermofilum sp. TaxID=1961369 RepID=UPI00258A55AE|nr:adenylate kinase [Thermofilum sp.]
MKLVFIGPPGVGKGTYAKAVSEKFGIPHISTGDIFREEIKKGSELGKRVKEFLDKGLLVPDDIVIEVVKQRLSMDDCRKGFILDGFPRTLQQAEALEQFASPEWAFLFQARDETILERLGGRRVCPNCGAIYHIKYMPPKVPGICDKCGTPLIQRKDDTPEVIMERLKIYREQFTPMILFYKERGRLVEIDANEQADKVVPVVIERLRKLYNV